MHPTAQKYLAAVFGILVLAAPPALLSTGSSGASGEVFAPERRAPDCLLTAPEQRDDGSYYCPYG